MLRKSESPKSSEQFSNRPTRDQDEIKKMLSSLKPEQVEILMKRLQAGSKYLFSEIVLQSSLNHKKIKSTNCYNRRSKARKFSLFT